MQRLCSVVVLAAPSVLVGCGNPCSGPTQIAGVEYTVFSSVRTFGAVSDEEDELAGFPSYETPVNGSHLWEFRWGGANVGPIVLVIDGQEFDGTGQWDVVDCGTFDVEIPEQTFVDSEGNDHVFVTSGFFMAFDQRLEGSLYWAEAWSVAEDGTDGTFVAEDVQVRGYAR
jgi:hypothetical protein